MVFGGNGFYPHLFLTYAHAHCTFIKIITIPQFPLIFYIKFSYFKCVQIFVEFLNLKYCYCATILIIFAEKEEDIYEDLCSFNSTEGQLEIQLMQPVEKRDYILKENTFYALHCNAYLLLLGLSKLIVDKLFCILDETSTAFLLYRFYNIFRMLLMYISIKNSII